MYSFVSLVALAHAEFRVDGHPRTNIYGYEKCSDVSPDNKTLDRCGIQYDIKGCDAYNSDDVTSTCWTHCNNADGPNDQKCAFFSIVKEGGDCRCVIKSLQGMVDSVKITADTMDVHHCNYTTFGAPYEFLIGCQNKKICAYNKWGGATWAFNGKDDDHSLAYWDAIDEAMCHGTTATPATTTKPATAAPTTKPATAAASTSKPTSADPTTADPKTTKDAKTSSPVATTAPITTQLRSTTPSNRTDDSSDIASTILDSTSDVNTGSQLCTSGCGNGENVVNVEVNVINKNMFNCKGGKCKHEESEVEDVKIDMDEHIDQLVKDGVISDEIASKIEESLEQARNEAIHYTYSN